jgi:phosphohistidine phosphatase
MDGGLSSTEKAPIQQASAIPFRYRDGALEFCLITSSSGRRWGFPKGIIDPGMSPTDTALQEAYEEAGIRGHLTDGPLGSYRYEKWGTSLDVVVYLMEVTEVYNSWPECEIRARAWLTADEALRCLDREELRELLGVALDRLGGRSSC